jgi:predicted nucleic acid-binding protein
MVVSDTTCITTLLKARRENILRELFDTIIIPPAVFSELRAFHSSIPEWIIQREAPAAPAITINLGLGESQAIALAVMLRADLFLSDDLQARSAAREFGLPCMGVIGLLIKAKRAGIIQSVGEELELVERLGGLYLTEELKQRALIAADEADL